MNAYESVSSLREMVERLGLEVLYENSTIIADSSLESQVELTDYLKHDHSQC